MSGNSFVEGGHIFRYIFHSSFNFVYVCFNNSTTADGVRLTPSTLQYPINHPIGVL